MPNSSKNLFCYWCFGLSCWFWVRRIRSLKRWIGLSRNSPVWDQTHQVIKVIHFLLLHLCEKQMKTKSKKIFGDFEVASSEGRLNSPLSWFNMNNVRLKVLTQNPSSDCFSCATLLLCAPDAKVVFCTSYLHNWILRHTFTRYSSFFF